MVEPESKHVPDMLRNEIVVSQKHTVSHTEAHRGIISPDTNLTRTGMQLFVHNSCMDVIEACLDDTQALLLEVLELCTGS